MVRIQGDAAREPTNRRRSGLSVAVGLIAACISISACSASVVSADVSQAADTPDGGSDVATTPDVGADVTSDVPTACSLMPSMRVGGGCFCNGAMEVVGDTAYRLGEGFEVISIASPDSPVVTSTLMPMGGGVAAELRYVRDRLLIASSALEVWDVTTPSNPPPV